MILHLVSGHERRDALLQPGQAHPLLTQLLSREGRGNLEMLLADFHPGSMHSAVIRQAGVPVHELSLSTRRLSVTAPRELFGLLRKHRPQVLHAWGASAQIAASALARVAPGRPAVVWSVAETRPATDASSPFGRAKLAAQRRMSVSVQRIVYLSEAAMASHRRAGFETARAQVIAAGLAVDRYKPDFAARKRIRASLEMPPDAFIVGMHAPYLPEFDHPTLIKAIAELMRTHPQLHLVLAGRGMQRGNALVMALLSGSMLANRTRLLGEWSDQAALFAACDVVCSSALTDGLRMTLAMAMLCGAACVGTGVGAQGETLGAHGIAIEPGSVPALIRALRRLLEMPNEKRALLAQQARRDALARFSLATALAGYHRLYSEVLASRGPLSPPV